MGHAKSFVPATLLAVAVAIGSGIVPAHAATLSDYIIIATGDKDGDNGVGQSFNMQDSEVGAISAEEGSLRFNQVSPPQGNPAFPGGTRGPVTGVITLDGDVAVTSTTGTVKLSNSDVHAVNKGPGNEGSQGIDCGGSYNACTNSGSDISTDTGKPLGPESSGSGFNQTPLPAGPAFSQVANNNGVQGGVAFGGLLTELLDTRNDYWGMTATETLYMDGLNNETETFVYGAGLHIVDISTDGNDFDLANSNWVVSGEEDTFVVFRVNAESKFNASNSNLLLGGSIGLNNVLFLLDSKDGDGSFTFNNVEFFGYSFWDYMGLGLKNEAVFNNVRGCGQVVADKVNFNNVSMTGCTFDPTTTEVPLPGTLPLLGLGLIGLGLARRKLC